MTPGPQFTFTPNTRYPDARVEVLDEAFLRYRLFSATVEQLASGMRWAEGPVWFGDGRYLLLSDIPNNRILRWDDTDGSVSEFRRPSNQANGHARDRQGRLLSCEHLTRRVTRTEYDGSITVLADNYEGKRLNSPNDITCQRNGAVWFTDPPFGILGLWEGNPAERQLPDAVYRIDPEDGRLTQVITDLVAPNGLAFSPDESVLYVVESRSKPHRKIWAYDVSVDGVLSNRRLYIDAQGAGALDGIAVDVDGNVWCGWGHDGSKTADGEDLDGVRVFDPSGKALARIQLPERCANLCFGGEKNNRVFMASCHSLYALYVNVRGAV
jgi:gluconolactonase